MSGAIPIPLPVQRSLSAAALAFVQRSSRAGLDFTRPALESALAGPHSVSWRIFKNPLALFVGGVAAVVLELADPAVRSGVWEHSSFLRDPVGRLQRTGLAALVTVYAARSVSMPMIATVARIHRGIGGTTPAGVTYRASDPQLLTWVHTTAAYGFAAAYSQYAERLSSAERDAVYQEGHEAALLYGALEAPLSADQTTRLFDAAHSRLEPSPIILEFLRIMRAAPALPGALRWLQPMLIRSAVELLPERVRLRVGLGERAGLRAGEHGLVRLLGSLSNRIVVPESPGVQSCRRLGLPANHLYR